MPGKNLTKNINVQAWNKFRRTFDSVVKCEESSFAKVGLPPQQFYVLSAIKLIHPPVTSTDVARWLDRNPNTITLIIDRMQKDGLVNRARNLKDRRACSLTITEKGQEMYEKALKPAGKLPGTVFSALSPEELTEFTTLLDKICENTYQMRNIKTKPGETSKISEKQ